MVISDWTVCVVVPLMARLRGYCRLFKRGDVLIFVLHNAAFTARQVNPLRVFLVNVGR
jgi:hypothetical protein